MKKYIIVFSLSLLTLAASAQKKKKKQIPPPKVEIIPEVLEKVPRTETISEPAVFAAPMPTTSTPVIHATTTGGKEIHFQDIEEFKNADLSTLKELSFSTMVSGKTIESSLLQKIVNEGTQLEVLTINNFALDVFPEIKTPNHRLKKLSLTQNQLKTLPSSISNLTALEGFDCNNPLTALPASFAQLKNLQHLGLNNYMFTAFPKEIFSLNKLSVLYLSRNYKSKSEQTELPDLFQQLPELKELGIENAGLSALPKSIAILKKLEKANFSYNKFTSFPEVLASNPKLTYIPFTNNPLQWEPFLASVKKIKFGGLFFLDETGLTKKQYEQIQDILTKTDVYYDSMND
ncbi:leucine-rich repeat domain-containing protein [Sphingobacterium sp. BIGb0165]|uniref:leucine-rich repeat domain-containing protein n=1 Tax=Sphingobacterium sp. BIGb0165 TaxID=2940615 RepID=UPI002167EB93|nr:leucine-rich repeat domain-containing protein [Sphingobacterium sp. BIGb0165]MCS4229084.1 Leucine-rich repeat (LRR) protein [Sphingobacterium sp. BIGb0165]